MGIHAWNIVILQSSLLSVIKGLVLAGRVRLGVVEGAIATDSKSISTKTSEFT